ncbi:hypothetical protein ABW21_db0203576 [Orbilia brochopaga]|nr:hypothetical protein ABW21_db0203576 [Drechslerella brochopaga]
MRSLTLLYIIAFAAAAPVLADNFTFGGWPLASCSEACYKDVLGDPPLKNCKGANVLCLCNEYAILGSMQDCLNRTNSCGSGQERTDTIFNIQAVCDNVLVAAAQPSSSGSATPAKATSNAPAPPAGTTLPEPTSLEEAEGRLGPSASALINKQPFHLSTGAKAGIAVGAIAGFLLLASIAFCCGLYHYKNHVIKKMNRDVNMNSPPAPEYTAADTAGGTDKGTYSSWFSSSTAAGFIKSHTRGATNDTHELGYGFDKELGLMISSSAPQYPPHHTFASAPTKMQTVDIQGLPQPLPQAVFPQRNPVVAPVVTRNLSVRSAKKPTVTVTQSEAIEDSSPVANKGASNIRVSVQSLRHIHQQANDSASNIPLMFFTPATPQVNVSPVSPSASSISGNGDIFGYYSRDSPTPENTTGSIGVAKTSLDRGAATSPEPYDPINNDVYNRATSPYTVSAAPASPYSLSMESRMPINGLDLSTEASSRGSTPSPTPGVGLHMPPRYTPYGSTERSVSPPLPPLPTASSPAPPPPSRTPEPIDRSATPTTISRSNSNKWRLSVERAADKALDKVRSAATAITSTGNSSGFKEVPEEEEALSKSDLLNTIEDSRGRRKNKATVAPRRADSGNPTPRSNSIGQSRSPSGRRTSNAANSAGGYRRSSSLGRYRNRTGSLSYNQIDGVNMPRGRSNRRGSNSSSVMLV